jgi:uncharacterized membrane protein YgcG
MLLALHLLLSLGAAAEGEDWSEDYYRILDFTDELSDEEVESLDGDCIEILQTYQVDLALTSVTNETLESESLEQWAAELYEYCSFGFGSGKDGFMAAYNADTEEVVILCFGNAAERVDADFRSFVCSAAPGYREEYGVFGVLYAVIRHTSNYLADPPSAPAPAPAPKNGRGGVEGKPDWYPTDPANFEKYHDPDAPRVVDTADIFTAAEEAEMEARLGEIRAELGRDIVIFTDVSAYGLGHAVYSADFYDFNGYGIGDEFEGACLFICMEPGDRGFWTCCTGPETRELFTEIYANQLDDRLYDYMAAGDYGDGAADWIENFRNLYRTGMPFPPSWLPEDGVIRRTHDAAVPRVLDELGLLSEEEVRSLTAEAKAISDQFGLDVVVLAMRNDSSFSDWEFRELYYQCKGYGFGENYDGIVLTLLRGWSYGSYFYVDGYGKGGDRLSTTNRLRIEDKAFDKYLSREAYDGLHSGLKDIRHMLKTGRVARPLRYWGWIAALGACVGAAFGGIALAGAKKKMAVPTVRLTAGDYLDKDSLRIDSIQDQYLSTDTTRKYSPVERSSGGGSSGGGGSSYSSSYSGSSGTSHSGSGRSF